MDERLALKGRARKGEDALSGETERPNGEREERTILMAGKGGSNAFTIKELIIVCQKASQD